MRPLNRPMFKMGGPVKEGIMDGIREPKADGGNIGGGVIEGRPAGKGRTGFNIVNLIGAGLTALRAAGPAALRGAQASKTYKPLSQNLGFLGRAKDIFLPRRSLTAPMASTPEKIGFGIGSFARTNPITTLLAPSTATEIATVGGPLALDAAKGFANLVVPGQRFDPFKGDEPEIEGGTEQKAELPGQDPKGGANVDSKVEVNQQGGSAPSNQFNDDGTKKDISVERLLKGIVKRARTDAAADTAIKFGQQLRTGEASIKDPSSVIDVASGEFDKVSDLQEKVNLALIENELKKQQIAAQATATTEKALEIEKRKRGMITMGDLVRADKSGMGLTHSGTLGIAREFADLTGKKYRGSIGNDDLLAKFEKNDRFKTDELGVITEKLQGGDDGLYILGTRVYEKSGPIVKLIKT